MGKVRGVRGRAGLSTPWFYPSVRLIGDAPECCLVSERERVSRAVDMQRWWFWGKE